MKTIKKAQTGVKQKPAAKSPVKKGPRRTTSGMWVDEDKFQPPFPVKYADEKPKVKAKVKAKNGAKFPDLNKDGKITKADILKGRGVIAQKGTKVKKQLSRAPKKKTGMDAVKALGKYVSTFGLATEGYNPAPSKKAKKTMKAGGSMKKCKYGCK
jgi:hypothetical protein